MNSACDILFRRSVVDTVATAAARPDLGQSVDSRSVRVVVLLSVIVALNLLDLAYTLLAHRVGLLNEMNPIAATLFRMDLEQSVVCFKVVTLLVGGLMLWRLRKSPWTPGACWLLVGIYLILSFVWLDWSANYVQAAEIETTTPAITFDSMRTAALANAH